MSLLCLGGWVCGYLNHIANSRVASFFYRQLRKINKKLGYVFKIFDSTENDEEVKICFHLKNILLEENKKTV
ncbi:hypothetical protein PthstB1num2_08560 [Parageobacillus thermoglucosidasius]|nr:hypothetical protein PthstB1num2_08560 [Parageobacillus thermoglucosidasius]